MFSQLFSMLDRVLGLLVGLFILLYQKLISARLPPVCVFTPSCSEFTRLVLADKGIWGGRALVRDRLHRCNGGVHQGLDCPPGHEERFSHSAPQKPRIFSQEEFDGLRAFNLSDRREK